jgi:hypothetical protein
LPESGTAAPQRFGPDFLGTYFRSGLYPLPLLFIPSAEVAGVHEVVAADVSAFARCTALGPE